MSDSALRTEDAAARVAALDITRSVVAQAPAGSGKTTLLIERYLRLLAHVDEPEEVLVVTFTRKAAGEIRTRIRTALDRGDDPAAAAVRERDHTRRWGLAMSPHRLRIQTIDGFALAIARLAPGLSGLPPQSRFAEDAGTLYREAVDLLFEGMTADGAFADDLGRVLALFENDYEACAGALCTMLGKRDQWLAAVSAALSPGTAFAPGTGVEGISHLIQTGASALAHAVIRDVTAALPETLLQELDHVVGEAARHLGTTWRGRLDDDVAAWRFVGEVLTTQDGHLRRQVGVRQGFPPGARDTKRRALDLLASLRERELDELIFNLRLLPDTVPTSDDLLSLRQIAITLSLAALSLTNVFEHASTVDFTELTFAARRALGSTQAPTDLAMALDYRLRHLLVDEFQDTSVSQLDLLTRITDGWQPDDGRTFFAVGDPMQSIYRFRDAEVALMLRAARDGVGDLRPGAVRLRMNYRAAPTLVEWVNRTFGPAFGRSDDPQLGRVAFAQAVAVRADPDSAGAFVSLFTGDTTRSNEAKHLLETIKRLRARDPLGSIALIARSRTHLDASLGALTAAGIPWHASDIENIGASTVVRDLMVLLDAACDLDDRLAWMSLLRAPFVGVSLPDLLVLAAAPRIADAVFTFDRYTLSEDGAKRLARIASVLERCLVERDQRAPAIWLESTWRQLGGPDAYGDGDATSDAEHLFMSLSHAGSRRVDRDTLRASLDRSFTRGQAEPGEVLVMTIHRAKGLEFDHVLIPGVDRETRRSEPPLLLWRAESRGLLMSTSHAADSRTYRWLAREERHREAYERLRLLYVAVTRARVSVHLVGCLDGEAPAAGSVLHTIWPTLRDTVTLVPAAAPPHAAAEQPHAAAPALPIETTSRTPGRRLKADYQAIERPLTKVGAVIEGPALSARLRTQKRLTPAIDRVLRRALSNLVSSVAPDDVDRFTNEQRATWRAALYAAGVRKNEADTGVSTIERCIKNVLLDPRGRWLFAPHNELVCGVEYTVLEQRTRIRIDVDRRFIDTLGQRWLVVVDTAGTSDHAAELSRWLAQILEAESTPTRAGIYLPALDSRDLPRAPHWVEV